MMRKVTQLFIVTILALIFYTGCDGDGDGVPPGADGRMAPAPVSTTGQTMCWNPGGNSIPCAGTGQDGDIQAGVVWPNPRFTDNEDGTITDNLTGLIWLKDANCPGEQRQWQPALNFARGLADGQCGLTDGSNRGAWRLPNIRELSSLVDFEDSRPSLPTGHPFMNFQSNPYWSSTSMASDPFSAWSVDFDSGPMLFNTGKGRPFFVLPVRGPMASAPAPVPRTGQTICWNVDGMNIPCAGTGQDGDIQAGVVWPNPRFTDNEDGTITDNLTGLIWLKDANCPGEQREWQPALSFANGLADGQCGLTDGSNRGAWRLPNIRELHSLVDFANFNPPLPTGHPFMNFQSLQYWSSTTDVSSASNGWAVIFTFGNQLNFLGKTNKFFVLPVRGGS